MDWHSTLGTVFLIAFWGGLVATVVMAVMSGAFHTEFGAGSAFEGGDALDLGGHDIDAGAIDSAAPNVGWADSQFPGASPLSPTVICSGVTGLGGVGHLALRQWDFGPGGALALGLVAMVVLGGASFLVLDAMLRRLQATSHVSEQALVGTKARVLTTIEPGRAGAIVLEAKGTRMTFPARAVDASQVPAGAEVEIRRVDGGVYVVEETRESWVARSKARPDHERWS